MFPHLLGRRGPGRYVTPGGAGDVDGGFEELPVLITSSNGDTTIKGKVKPGAFGKMVVPLGTLAVLRQYTIRIDANFSQLAKQGKLAMIGFGFKSNNDFQIVGLRGDGSTGTHKYEVHGTPPNGWNKDTGHTESDGGAASVGTQYTSYFRLLTNTAGTAYTIRTSTDGTTWTDEFTDRALTPFTDVTGVVQFGAALWLNNTDAGPFTVTVTQYADAVNYEPTVEGKFSTWHANNYPALAQEQIVKYNDNSHIQGAKANIGYDAASSPGYYMEWLIQSAAGNNSLVGLGNASADVVGLDSFPGFDGNSWGVYQNNGNKYTGGVGSSYGSSFTTNDVIMMYLKAGKLWWGKNGTWFNSGDPVAGTNAAFTGLTGTLYPMAGINRVSSPGPDFLKAKFDTANFSYSIPTGGYAWGKKPRSRLINLAGGNGASDVTVTANVGTSQFVLVVWGASSGSDRPMNHCTIDGTTATYMQNGDNGGGYSGHAWLPSTLKSGSINVVVGSNPAGGAVGVVVCVYAIDGLTDTSAPYDYHFPTPADDVAAVLDLPANGFLFASGGCNIYNSLGNPNNSSAVMSGVDLVDFFNPVNSRSDTFWKSSHGTSVEANHTVQMTGAGAVSCFVGATSWR